MTQTTDRLAALRRSLELFEASLTGTDVIAIMDAKGGVIQDCEELIVEVCKLAVDRWEEACCD